MLPATTLPLKLVPTDQRVSPRLKIVISNSKKKKKKTLAMLQAQEQERNEIGMELHDNVNQVLAAAKLYLEAAMTGDKLQQPELLLKKSHGYLEGAIFEIRKISHQLVTPTLRETTLAGAITELLVSIRATTLITVNFIAANYKAGLIDEEQKLMLYRIIQEHLNNIIKHAHAQQVTVTLVSTNCKVMLTISDDGKGFDLATARMGIGMKNIRNRVDCLNASMKLSSSPGHGCSLSICIPLEKVIAPL